MAPPTPAQRPLPKSLPTILYWNAGGITRAKQDEFYKNVHDQDADVFCISEAGKIAEKTDVNLRDLATPNYTIHILERSRQIASGLIVGVRSTLISAFQVTHKMEPDNDKIEIATLDVWLGKKKNTIHMIYNPPNNKTEVLETLKVNRNTIIVGAFNAPHTDWGYRKTEEVGKIVAEFIHSNAVLLLEDEDEENRCTFLSNSGHTSRPDLSLAHTAIADDLTTVNLDCPTGRGHKIIKLMQSEEGDSKEPPYLRWNFKKANWEGYTKQLEQLAES
jgi:Endonuclease-reverse transcriptase